MVHSAFNLGEVDPQGHPGCAEKVLYRTRQTRMPAISNIEGETLAFTRSMELVWIGKPTPVAENAYTMHLVTSLSDPHNSYRVSAIAGACGIAVGMMPNIDIAFIMRRDVYGPIYDAMRLRSKPVREVPVDWVIKQIRKACANPKRYMTGTTQRRKMARRQGLSFLRSYDAVFSDTKTSEPETLDRQEVAEKLSAIGTVTVAPEPVLEKAEPVKEAITKAPPVVRPQVREVEKVQSNNPFTTVVTRTVLNAVSDHKVAGHFMSVSPSDRGDVFLEIKPQSGTPSAVTSEGLDELIWCLSEIRSALTPP